MALRPKERAFAAIFAGLLAGFIVISLIEMFTPFQPPADVNSDDNKQMSDWIATLPISAFLILLMAYFLGSAIGGFTTNKIAGPTRYRPALLTGFGLFAAGAANFFTFPHPVWFMVASAILYFAGAWVGGRAAK
jgi:MFS family permease